MMGLTFGEKTFRSILFLFIALSHTVPLVSSSSNRNNYNVYNYDQTTPQFTPDGRLLQVEYASSAADSSPPIVVVEFSSPRSTSSSKSTNNMNDKDHHRKENEEVSSSYPCTVLLTIRKQPSSLQNRMIIIENNESIDPSNASLQRRSRHPSFCLAMSGILADSLALLQAGMKVAAEHSLQYQDSFGLDSLARALADECQSRVFAGGLRPYGSTLLLCGYDDGFIAENQTYLGRKKDGKSNFNGIPRRHSRESLIYQTDPSGGILQHRSRDTEDRKHSRNKINVSKKKSSRKHGVPMSDNVLSQVRCIVGGSSDLQRQLHKQINLGMSKFEQRRQQQHRNRKEFSSPLADRIANVAKILIKETAASNGSTDHANNSLSTSRTSKKYNSVSSDYPLEIVIVSPILGCYRLKGKQLQGIRNLIDSEK